jgi:hypothetical protein
MIFTLTRVQLVASQHSIACQRGKRCRCRAQSFLELPQSVLANNALAPTTTKPPDSMHESPRGNGPTDLSTCCWANNRCGALSGQLVHAHLRARFT